MIRLTRHRRGIEDGADHPEVRSPSSAASGLSTRRCASTQRATACTSSGVTNSPLRNPAWTRAARSNASAPRVDRPSATRGCSRVACARWSPSGQRFRHVQRAGGGARLVQQYAVDAAQVGRNGVARLELGAVTLEDLAFGGASGSSCRCAA